MTKTADIPSEEITKRFPLSVEHFREDALGLEPFCRKLEDYLIVDHDFVEGSLVVSLNAPFGFGKSTFLKMWENDLRSRLKKETSTPLAINLNAWESDYYDEPLLPIISALIEAIESQVETPDDDPKFQDLKIAAKDVAWFTLGIANSLIKESLKVDVIEAGKFAEGKRDAREETSESKRLDLLDEYQKRRHALWNLKRLLKEYLEGDTPKAFIFIDELDRCRPNYAVSYLETIKHVFDINGLVFVLAVDYEHLQNSAKSLYGPDLKFPEYFRKFVHRSFDLPEATPVKRKELAKRLIDFYLHNKSNRFTRLNMNECWPWLPDLLVALRMAPRQAMEFFRILGHLSSAETEQNAHYHVGYGIGMILMCALKVSEPSIYHKLGRGQTPHGEVARIIADEIEPHRARWLYMVYAVGTNDYADTYKQLKAVSLLDKSDTDKAVSEATGHIHMTAWGMIFSNAYPKFYAQIESKEFS